MANISDVVNKFNKGELPGQLEKKTAPEKVSNNEALIKNDSAHIAFEAISGVFGDLPKNAALNPMKFLASGPVGVQFQSGVNTPSQIANILRKEDSLPSPNEENNLDKLLPKAETKTGEILGFGANLVGGLVGYPGKATVKAIDSAADFVSSSTAGARKVKKVQQAFFQFQKDATTKYGQALRGARKADDFSALPKATVKEVESIFEPIHKVTDEVAVNVPSMRKIKKIAETTTKDLSLEDMIKVKQRLRKTMSVGERKGIDVTDRSKLVTQTIRNIDKALIRKVPGMAKENKDYAMFVKIKEIVEKFEPRFGNMPAPFGTSNGQRFLRQVANFTEEEVKLLQKFENASGLKIVGSAKLADRVDKMGRMIGKLAGLTATIGALKAVGADKLFFQVADITN